MAAIKAHDRQSKTTRVMTQNGSWMSDPAGEPLASEAGENSSLHEVRMKVFLSRDRLTYSFIDLRIVPRSRMARNENLQHGWDSV